MDVADPPLLVGDSQSVDSEFVVHAQSRFRAMGTSVHLIVGAKLTGEDELGFACDAHHCATDLLAHARRRIEEIEACVSRFLIDSELSQLNRLAGFPTVVSPQLFSFIAAAWHANKQTRGSFDPTIGASLRSLGYDRPFEEMVDRTDINSTATRATPQVDRSACTSPDPKRRFEVDQNCRTVSCSADVQLDLGGIAKGMTADILAEELLQLGAAGASINIGGDVRVQGVGPNKDGSWSINLTLPGAQGEEAISLAAGGVCTSAVTERQWSSADGRVHHIIDPETGRSARSNLRSISVVSRTAAAAEVLATAALVDGHSLAVEHIGSKGATGILVTGSGEVVELPGFDTFSAATAMVGRS